MFHWSNGNGHGEVFDFLDLQVAWTLLLLQLAVIYWHEAHKRYSNMVMVQTENRFLQQEGNQDLQGWHWWSREGQRAKHDRKRREHMCKWPDEGKSSTLGVKEILPVPHWRRKILVRAWNNCKKLSSWKWWVGMCEILSCSFLFHRHQSDSFSSCFPALSPLPSRIPLWSQMISQVSLVSILSWPDLPLILQLRNYNMVGYHMCQAFSCHCLGVFMGLAF